MKTICPRCNGKKSPRATTCRSCAQYIRWENPVDQRRQRLQEYNNSVRNGYAPYKDREWCRSRYEDKKMSIRDLAREASCGIRTIARWLSIHNIQTRIGIESIKNRSGENNPNWKAKSVCPDCYGKKGCSSKRCQRCHWKFAIGENHPAYKGIYEINEILREWSGNHWRPQVFDRDNYICQKCGIGREGELEAHHIIGFADIVKNELGKWSNSLETHNDKIKFCEYVIENSLIKDIKNGITLCNYCHKKEHNKLADCEVLEIVAMHKNGFSKQEIANKFQIDQANVNAIISGKTWNHITGIVNGK